MNDSYLTPYQERLVRVVYGRYIYRGWLVPVDLEAKLNEQGLFISPEGQEI